jgi:hypothetical protein
LLNGRQQHKWVDDGVGRGQWSRQKAIGLRGARWRRRRRDCHRLREEGFGTMRGGKEKYNNQQWLMKEDERRGKAIAMMITAFKMTEVSK